MRTAERDGLQKGVNSRNRKKAREIIDHLLNQKITNENELQELQKKYGIEDVNDINLQLVIIDKQIQKACDGDIKATEFLFGMLGENEPKDEHEIKLPIFNIEVVDNSELEKEFDKYMEME